VGAAEQVGLQTEHAAGRVSAVLPWQIAPYDLVSWWQMQQFSAWAFYYIGRYLEQLRVQYRIGAITGGGDPAFSFGRATRSLEAEDNQGLIRVFEGIRDHCASISLQVAVDIVNGYIDDLSSGRIANHEHVERAVVTLDKIIQSEMRKRVFMFISPDKSRYYRQAHSFGELVNKAFPSIESDAERAGGCYATGFNTASVFHLMRVLESGLAVLATELQVACDRRNWENIINDIEAAVRKIKGPHAGADWKERQEQYSGAALNFRYFKDAWRNHVMHCRTKYDEGEALRIYEHVKDFMQHLERIGLHEVLE
jgi:hypothetical protein